MAGMAAMLALAAASIIALIQGNGEAAGTLLIWAVIAVTPAIAAAGLSIFRIREEPMARPCTILLVAFPVILAAGMGLEALDGDANHRILRAAASLITVAGAAPAAAALVMRNRG